MLSFLGLNQLKVWPQLMQMNHNDDYMYGTGGRSAQPCRACTDFKQWSQKQIKSKTLSEDIECPLSRDQLGRNTWSLLHTMAAYYPKDPTPQQQNDMKAFIQIFSRFYPCDHCAEDFRKDITTDPPQTQNQHTLSQWFCHIHNKVNKKLGKELFDCNKVDERWLKGWSDGSCD
ncbi:FAD-linked sulfhydryl oxidase ALR-like [Oppia nitens]|uniref:FAD-linked sulfhydryl oxidase ALR-like n=1 Tax=Oppia nitens TaxID=1686743 RepID=UPI0023DB6D8E|nr:FAD-linked sulfhydryl oxidase ALR-like [Oppia nitens]